MPRAAARFRLRARWTSEKIKGGGYQVVITEVPFQVQKSRLIEKIADLLAAKKLTHAGRRARRVGRGHAASSWNPRARNVDPGMLMESTLPPNRPGGARLPQHERPGRREHAARHERCARCLQAFLDHRQVVLVRRSQHRLEKIAHRLAVLEGYLVAYLNLDEVIRIIREEDEPKKRR